jgi:hypothetical protein
MIVDEQYSQALTHSVSAFQFASLALVRQPNRAWWLDYVRHANAYGIFHEG